ncbi:MAG: EamA family transporter [Armatimonadetes bacterium]|jgi:drug/metabolite transporter (DMT)-like permease|nr:EamA family transporter [Armatimonadota bacterium]
MIGWLYLAAAVAGGVALWPLGRWAMQKDGQATILGFWISLTGGVLGLSLVILLGRPLVVWPVWGAGLAFGVAYAVGFCMLIMHCLKIGPAGPTVTINNMAMVCGVLYGALWLKPHPLHPSAVLGVAGTCVALLLLGKARPSQEVGTPGVNPRWLKLVMAGGAFSGLSFITQTHVGVLYVEHSFLFVSTGFFISALILLPGMLRARGSFGHRRERTAGLGIGSVNALLGPVGLAAMHHVGAEVMLPVSLVTPIVVMLLVGHFAYRERLDRLGWAGSLAGLASVALLALGSS